MRKLFHRIVDLLRGPGATLCGLAFVALALCPHAAAQPTIVGYQGQLLIANSPANGNYDLTFSFFVGATGGTPLAGPIASSAVPVNNGLFTVYFTVSPGIFDFGAAGAHFLEIAARPSGSSGPYTTLSPRQPLTDTPYAIAAETAGTANGVAANAVTAAGIASGQVVKSLNGLEDAVTLVAGPNVTITPNASGSTVTIASTCCSGTGNDWLLTGNAGTTAGLNFLGTIDDQPVELHVNSQRALRLEPDGSGQGSPNVIGGSPNNLASGAIGATIGGGGSSSAINTVTAGYGTVSGGSGNTASGIGAFVGGGGYDGGAAVGNTAAGAASVVGGGIGNQVRGDYGVIAGGYDHYAGVEAFVGGGDSNSATGEDSAIAGGERNITSNHWAAVGGGTNNTAGGTASSVAGGFVNTASGDYAAIGGGFYNVASNGGTSVGGGYQNVASGWESTIGGGDVNSAQGEDSTVGGGEHNLAGAWHATVGGGTNNQASGSASFVGGGEDNTAGQGWAVVSGGQSNVAANVWATVCGGAFNYAGVEAFVGGGDSNVANGEDSTVAGGEANTAAAHWTTVGGGAFNKAYNPWDVIAGGSTNTILYATGANGNNAIGGGALNFIDASQYGSIGGGLGNFIGTASNLFYANGCTIPGGVSNLASGNFSFAAGQQAKAVHDGAFVWADSQNAPFSSSASDQVSFRCLGGVRFTSGSGGIDQTICWTPGSGGWSLCSDRNLKENFQPVDVREVLEKVVQLPLSEWSYKGYPDRHVGPMAQDFHQAFPFNPEDKMLNSADETGVALAAIQGLNQKLTEKDSELHELKQQNNALAQQLHELQAIVQSLQDKR